MRLNIFNQKIFALMLTIAALMVGQNSALAQATSEVGVVFGWEQNKVNSSYYRYSIQPWNLNTGDLGSNEWQTSNYVRFNDQVYNIGDDNIPLTMILNGKVKFTDAGNFTVDNGGSKFEITFTSATKYIMGVSVYNSIAEAVSDCTITGSGTKSVTVKIPDQTVFSKVILTIANHTPFDKDNSATISGIADTYIDDGVNEPVPTVTYRESNGSAPVTLTAGTDYTVSYSNNHYLGTATLTVTGAGNYIGSVSKNYVIRSYDLRDFNKLGEGIYEIATKDDLDHLAIYVNRNNDCQGVTFRQKRDITYTHKTANEEGADTDSNYTAIGNNNNPFRGTFDGAGKTISGIRIYQPNANYQGLFGYVSDGTIKNVTLTDAVITGKQVVGGIVGYTIKNNNTGGIIENCHVTNSVTIHAVVDYAHDHGGIVGSVNGGSVSGCTSAATLTIKDGTTECKYFGGIVGELNGNLQDCLVVGSSISGTKNVGAVAGFVNSKRTITANYYRNVTVNGTANATNVGVGSESLKNGIGPDPDLTPHDRDGICSLHTLTLGTGITAVGSETKVIDNVTYYASNTTVTLSYSGTLGANQIAVFSLDGTELVGNTFTMPAADASVTASPTTASRSGAVTFIEKNDGKCHAIIDGNYSGTDAIAIPDDIVVDNVSFIRTFPVDAYCTLVLPFEISTSNLTGVNSVLSFKYMTNDANGMLDCAMQFVWRDNEEDVELQAYTPYIVLMNNSHLGITGPVIFERTRDAFNDNGDWEIRGTAAYTVWDATHNNTDLGRVYGFAATAVAEDKIEIGDFVRAEAGAFIRPLRAFLYYKGTDSSLSHSQSLRRAPAIDELPDRIPVRIVEDEDADRISLTPALSKGEGDWYTIDGRKLGGKPKASGIYIRNGKKMVK